MCGLWASLGLEVPRAVLDAVSHRGPDDEGWARFDLPLGPLVLGVKRLSIIDLSSRGHQPMQRDAGRLTIIFNGEIYNYLDLRRELQALGQIFVSESDTEVLLAAYDVWGDDCLRRLNGMFAFVIYDAGRQRLFAARDRFGVKPLYYHEQKGGICFASEIKQFTFLPGFRAYLDRQAAFDFLTGGYSDVGAGTALESVRQLRGGEFLVLPLERQSWSTMQPRVWYAPPPPGSVSMTIDEAASWFTDLLRDAVRLRLRADVPVGFCLSGGLDSSSIVSVAAESHNNTRAAPMSFSACYDDVVADERHFIDAVVRQTGSPNHRTFPQPDDIEELSKLLAWIHDGPLSSTSFIAQWHVFKLAKSHGVKVMLDGQGADETLAGYHSMFAFHQAELLRAGRILRLGTELLAQRRRHGATLMRQLGALAAAALPMPMTRVLRGLARRPVLPTWMARRGWDGIDVGHRTVDRAWTVEVENSPKGLGAMSVLMTRAVSLPMLLRAEDRNSMAHSVEARLPFLDFRLVDLALGLGGRHKIVDGETKVLLRRAMAGILPEEVRTRQDKIGFATPEAAWFSSPLKLWLADKARATARRFPDLIDEQRLSPLVERLAVSDDARAALWRIASFGDWMERFAVDIR